MKKLIEDKIKQLKDKVINTLSDFGKDYIRGTNTNITGPFVLLTGISLTVFFLSSYTGNIILGTAIAPKIILGSVIIVLLLAVVFWAFKKGADSFFKKIFNPYYCAFYLLVLPPLLATVFSEVINDAEDALWSICFGIAFGWFAYGKMAGSMYMCQGYYSPRKIDFTFEMEPGIVETNVPEVVVIGEKSKYVFRKRGRVGLFELPIFACIYFSVIAFLLLGLLWFSVELIKDPKFISAGYKLLYFDIFLILGFVLSILSWIFYIKEQVKFGSVSDTKWKLEHMGFSKERVEEELQKLLKQGYFGPISPGYSNN